MAGTIGVQAQPCDATAKQTILWMGVDSGSKWALDLLAQVSAEKRMRLAARLRQGPPPFWLEGLTSGCGRDPSVDSCLHANT